MTSKHMKIESGIIDVSELVKMMNDAAALTSIHFAEDGRMKLLTACANLRARLETPFETTIRFMFGTHQAVALKTAIDMKIFDTVAIAPWKDYAIRIEDFAAPMKADKLLTFRILRLLTGMRLLKQTAQDRFVRTPFTLAYATGSPLAEAVIHLFSNINILSKIPEYLGKQGYRNPDDPFHGPFQYAKKTAFHYFMWLKNHQKDQAAFNTMSSISRKAGTEEWFNFYPVEDRLGVVSENQEPLLVDVGGGIGQNLIAFKSRFPNLSGRLILQDGPSMIKQIKYLPAGIEAMYHPPFRPQPVKGAKAYFLRINLDTWPDAQVRGILGNVKIGMNKDSRLLIYENTLPEQNVPLYLAMFDLSKMALFSSWDRTIPQWKKLLYSVGFEAVQVWEPRNPRPGSGTLFEAMLKSD